MAAVILARPSWATTTSTIAPASANQKAQACRRPRRRGTTSSRANSSGEFIALQVSAARKRGVCPRSHFAQQTGLLLVELGSGDQPLVAQLAQLLDLLERVLA